MNSQFENIAAENSIPCVSISLNTHRTHPDNISDVIELKKLVNEAEDRVIAEFGKRPIKELLSKIDGLAEEIDNNYNLDSLHIFLSNSTKEVIRSPWPIQKNTVHISDRFSIKPLIKMLNRTQNYLVLILSQSSVKLLHIINDGILNEINNGDFPFNKNPLYLTQQDKLSDGKQVENMAREFLNTVDKAVVKVNNDTGMNCVAISTESNYHHLLQVADKPSIYYGFVHANHNDVSNNTIAADAWAIVNSLQKQSRTEAIKEMLEAAGQGKVLTDIATIYKAVKEGRGDLLITHNDFQQAVKMTGEFSFISVDDVTQPDTIDDISSEIAWEVISKKGRAIFTSQEEIKSLGNIALKVRY
jgi:hypothetical protein